MAKELADKGCDSICIKDMAGLIAPKIASELVTAIKAKVSIPISLHSHCSSGMAPMSYQAAADAGISILDTAFTSFAWGTSQPPTESIAAAFKDAPYDTGYDLEKLYEIGEYFVTMKSKYKSLFTEETLRPSINVLLHQTPGGMLSNLVNQLKEQNALNKMNDVLEELPKVRADLGYPPLVTPTSQILGIQAVLNVLTGQRYKMVTQEVKNYLHGQYGKPPAPMNAEIRKQIIGDKDIIECRPADLIEPELEANREEADKLGILKQDEDLMTYTLYPRVAVQFLKGELKEEVLAGEQEEEVPAK
jgi:pyruvate carboxylase subunit B